MKQYEYLVFGSNSPVGRRLTDQLAQQEAAVLSISRNILSYAAENIEWKNLAEFIKGETPVAARTAICVFHIWLVPDIVARLAECGVTRVVCLSSTSLFGTVF